MSISSSMPRRSSRAFARGAILTVVIFISSFLISPISAQAAVTLQGEMIDGFSATSLNVGGGAIIPLAQFMLTQSSGSDTLDKVGVTLVADTDLNTGEISRISLWKESGGKPGFQIDQDTYTGAGAAVANPAKNTFILLDPTTNPTVGVGTQFYIVASTTSTANIVGGHSFHLTADTNYASTSAETGLGNAFVSSKVITLNRSSAIKISEVKAGSTNNVSDEFIELYNPSDTTIDLSNIPLNLHTFYANGSSTPISINYYYRRIIPPFGYFLITSQSGYSSPVAADATFSTTSLNVLIPNGGVSIATTTAPSAATNATTSAIDFLGWGDQPTANCEGGVCAVALAENGASLERLASTTSTAAAMAAGGGDAYEGNGWDSGNNNNNFKSQSVNVPQNSISFPEYPFQGGGGGVEEKLRVASSYPGPNMTGVPVDMAYIGFNFNKPASSTTITTSNVSFKAASGGSNLCTSVTFNPNATNFEPQGKCTVGGGLSPSTQYVFTVTSSVQDISGNALDQDSFAGGNQVYQATSTTGNSSQTFTSTMPPFIVGTTPFPGSVSIPKNLATIAVEFNQLSMKTSTLSSSNITLVNSSGASIALTDFAFSTTTGKNILTFTPGALAVNTQYTLTVGTGVRNTNEVPLSSSYISKFTTGADSNGDTTAPSLVGVLPTPGGTIAASTNDFVFTFDDSLDSTTVTTSSVILKIKNGANLPASVVRYDPVAKEGHFIAANSLPVGQTIQLVLKTDLKNIAGVAVASDITREYIVETTNSDTTPPSVLFANGNEFEFAITFNEAINPVDATNLSNYTITVGGTAQTLSALAGHALTYDAATRSAKLTGLRLAASSFTVTAVNIKDTSGNLMTSSSFTGTISSSSGGDRMSMGMVGPGTFSGSTFGEAKDFSSSGIGFMPPVEIKPSSFTVNASSTYTFGLPISKQIPAGGTIVVTFPSTSDFGVCCAATSSTKNTFVNEQNKDINGPGPGTIGINTVAKNAATKTVTLTISAATRSDTYNGSPDYHDFLNFNITDIKNPSIPKGLDSSGYTIDIKSKNADGELLESFNANPVYIGGGNTGGGATTTIRGTVTDSADSGTLGGVTVHLMSPQTGMIDATTASDGTYSFSDIAVGSSFTTSTFGGGTGSEFYINTDAQVSPTTKNGSDAGSATYFGEPMPTPMRATSTSLLTRNLSLVPTSGNSISFTIKLTAAANTFDAGEQLDIFAGGPGKFMSQTVTLDTSARTAVTIATLTMPKVNGRWGIGIGPAMPKGGGAFSGPPPSTDWAMPKPIEATVNGCPSSCNVTVNGASATTYTFTISAADKTIAGKVQDASGNAISGVQVYAYSPSGGTGNHGETSASGAFSVKVTEGSYNVGAFFPGMGQSKEVPVVVSGNSYYVDGSTVAATASTFIIKMTKPSYTITGQVTDGTNPMSAPVFAYRTDSPGHADAMSDSGTGNYTLYVDSGTWKISSFIPGFGPMPEQTVTISGSSQSNINFSPSTSNSMSVLSGRVYEDADGSNSYNSGDTAISGAIVRVTGSTASSWNEGSTDSDGNYSIRVVSGSAFTIQDVFHPTYNRIAPIGDNGSLIGSIDLTSSTTKNIKVPARKNVTITMKDSGGAALTVTKTFVDIFNPSIRSGSHTEINNASTTIVQIATSSSAYEMRVYVQGVPAGNVSIAGADANTVVTNNTFVVNGNEGITVTVNTATAPVRTVIGRVLAGDTAVADAWVQFMDQANGIHVGAMSTSTGWYNISLAEGTYQAVVSKPGYIGAPSTVTVSGNTTQNLTVTQSSRTISGSVTAGGSTAKDAFVRAEKIGGGHAISKTDTSGAFTLNVSEGRWKLYAAADGYAESSYSSGAIIDTTSASASGVTISLSSTVSVNTKLATSNTFTDTNAGTFSDTDIGVSVKLDGSTLGSSGSNAYMTAKETSNIPNTDSVNIIGSTGLDINAYSGSSQVKNLQSGKTATVEMTYTKADLTSEGVDTTGEIDELKVVAYSEDKQEWESLSTVPTYKDSSGNVLAESDVTASLANVASVTFTALGTHFSAYALSEPQGVEPPGTPSGLSVVPGSAGTRRITLTWNASSGGTAATGYYIYRDTSLTGTFAQLADVGNVTTYTDTTPVGGTTYYYKVAGYAQSGTLESSASGAIDAMVRGGSVSGSGGGGGGTAATTAVPPVIARTVTVTTPVTPTATAVTTGVTAGTGGASAMSIKRPLSRGLSGPDVTTLQTLLSQDPSIYPEKSVTGYFGPATERAVKAFQTKYKLPSIGVVGPMTKAMLTEVFGTTPATPATPATPSSGALSRPLKPGSTGSDVKTLQQFLNSKGFTLADTGPGSPGSETTYMGAKTVEAIKKFQTQYGIISSGSPETTGYGSLGPKTRAKINELLGQ